MSCQRVATIRIATMLALWAAAALPAAAQSNRFLITRGQVTAAIDGAGMHVSDGQVTLLSDVVSATGNPALKVESVEGWGDRKVMVRLECANPGECLPFIVAVRRGGADQQQLAPSSELQPLSSSGKSRLSEPTRSSDALRVGSTAVLLLDGTHVHIQLPVVCLENGSIGQSIRVATRDRRLTFTAEIVSDSTLRGQL
jgi:hypothetical protein